jgi:hypothetical protein
MPVCYKGLFKSGRIIGKGEIQDESADFDELHIYKGFFSKGQLHGIGTHITLTNNSLHIYNGNFDNGSYHGVFDIINYFEDSEKECELEGNGLNKSNFKNWLYCSCNDVSLPGIKRTVLIEEGSIKRTIDKKHVQIKIKVTQKKIKNYKIFDKFSVEIYDEQDSPEEDKKEQSLDEKLEKDKPKKDKLEKGIN